MKQIIIGKNLKIALIFLSLVILVYVPHNDLCIWHSLMQSDVKPIKHLISYMRC